MRNKNARMLTGEIDEFMCAPGLSDDCAWSALRLNRSGRALERDGF
jgi:hypothetical protein